MIHICGDLDIVLKHIPQGTIECDFAMMPFILQNIA